MKRTLAAALAVSLFGAAFAGNSYFFGKALKDSELDQLRGGLSVATSVGQLNLSFGIERAVIINDELVAVTQLLIPQLTGAMGKGVSSAGVSTVGASKVGASNAGVSNVGASNVKIAELAPVVVIQKGPGNIAMPDIAQLNSAIGTVIQNTLNQQHIQTATVITVTANSMELVRSSAHQAAIAQAISNSAR